MFLDSGWERRLEASPWVMSCIDHFLARGLPVAAGWRSWEQLKASGISPDGMVFLERSPYGPTWAYFEVRADGRG